MTERLFHIGAALVIPALIFLGMLALSTAVSA